MSKYDPLSRFLEDTVSDIQEVTLSFKQIEQILGDALPNSAKDYPQSWWGNERTSGTHIQALAWIDAGWKVDTIESDKEWVRFKRS